MNHLTLDNLQNELLTISHHLDDIEKAIKKGDSQYALEGIKDANEAVDRLSKFLPDSMNSELNRMAESYGPADIAKLL